MLQAGDLALARTVVNIPAKYADIGGSIYQWAIETLFNQYLLTPYVGSARGKTLGCSQFETLARLQDKLLGIEDAESGVYLRSMDIFDEVSRIAYRQFHWQRGYHNVVNYYRSAYLFGQGECAKSFAQAYGLTINEFSLAGIALLSQAVKRAGIPRQQQFDVVGLRPEALASAIERLAAPVGELRRLAKQRRFPQFPIAYQPSTLREYPLVAFDPGYVAPIPTLIELRTTAGIYYDVVRLGGSVTTEIGKRFEGYSLEFLQAMISSDLSAAGSFDYGRKGHRQASPDILVRRNGVLELIVECKSKKLTFDDQFGSDRWNSPGFNELVKGVQQIWKFASDIRRGMAARESAGPNLHGLVLTLDSWGQMSPNVLKVAFERAGDACSKFEGFEECDKVPVALCSMDELESAAENATPEGLSRAIHIATAEDARGRFLPHIVREEGLSAQEPRAYPFMNRVGEVLPWWAGFDAAARKPG